MLMRALTSVRDMSGPVFALKRGIDLALVDGPSIWPAGAFSQAGVVAEGGLAENFVATIKDGKIDKNTTAPRDANAA